MNYFGGGSIQMGKYGEVALQAVTMSVSNGIAPRFAWEKAANTVFGAAGASADKGCPRDAFFGLCTEGLVRGIPAANYTRSRKNKQHALSAVEFLRENSEFSGTPRELWARVMRGVSKTHNQQMDVVLALWGADLRK